MFTVVDYVVDAVDAVDAGVIFRSLLGTLARSPRRRNMLLFPRLFLLHRSTSQCLVFQTRQIRLEFGMTYV